jgi:ubiquitin-conjugating enzyme E2 J1
MSRCRSRDWRCQRCEKTNLELLPDAAPCVQTIGSSDHAQDVSNEGRSSHAVSVDNSNKTAGSNGSSTTPPSLVPHTTADAEPQAISSPNIDPSPQPSTIQRQHELRRVHSRSARPPLVLDGAIAVCLTMLVAILWKKIF